MPGFQGWLPTDAGRVPRVSTELLIRDQVGACKARWGIGRMNYLVPPGLYAIGTPTAGDPVLVTANYKMSFDIVRSNMTGRNVWLLVLETFGINVWCAAGKGTFGTDELVRQVQGCGLAKVVSHRRLILPVLGAPGVAAHEVARRTGFSVRYATIRATDLPEFLDNGMVTTPPMRELTFTTYERLVLVPVELVMAVKPTAAVVTVLGAGCALAGGASAGVLGAVAYLGAVFAGLVCAPVLLPWLPARSFSVKGAMTGIAWAAVIAIGAGKGAPLIAGAALLGLPAVSAFYTLNFTGCTTFTSRSGVRKEMRLALPAMGSAITVSLLLLALSLFV